MERLYINIKNRREELGMSQEELAKRLGYKSRSSINKIEMGINDLPQSKIKDFAAVLDTTVSELMGWDEEYNPDGKLAAEVKAIEKKRELSIEERANQILSGLMDDEGDTLMLDGQAASPEAVEAFKSAIEMGVELARRVNKDKAKGKTNNEDDNKD